ncbi:hypothetical protein KSS87_013589 [Heliosperma pusillum]|nr:hypothetical protein KSS87_013589 [Heliosperma pusillum]
MSSKSSKSGGIRSAVDHSDSETDNSFEPSEDDIVDDEDMTDLETEDPLILSTLDYIDDGYGPYANNEWHTNEDDYSAQTVGECTWAIKNVRNPGHGCVGVQDYNPMATSEWVAKKLLPDIRANPDISGKSIKDLLLERYGLKMKTSTVYKMKDMTMREINGGHDESYRLLPAYLVNATSDFTFKKALEQIVQHGGMGAGRWFLDLGDEELWTKHKFDHTISVEDNTSNFVESFNSTLGVHRTNPVLSLLEVQRYKQAYGLNIAPMPDTQQWPKFDVPTQEPLTLNRSIGRPSRDRRREQREKRKGALRFDYAFVIVMYAWHSCNGVVKTVKVSNVSCHASEQDLKELFSFSGDIVYMEIKSEDKETLNAYVTFKDSQGADTAVLLTGATITDKTITISLDPDYELPPAALARIAEGQNPQSALQKAEDVVSTVLAKGFILGKSAAGKAKSFDEKHRLTSTASLKISSLDQKTGFTEKVNMGTSAVNYKVKEYDQKFQVSEKTKTAFAMAEEKVGYAGSTVMKNRYVLIGATWVTGAFNKVAKAASDIGQKTKEKVRMVEDEQKRKIVEDFAHAHLSDIDSPKDSFQNEQHSAKPDPVKV